LVGGRIRSFEVDEELGGLIVVGAFVTRVLVARAVGVDVVLVSTEAVVAVAAGDLVVSTVATGEFCADCEAAGVTTGLELFAVLAKVGDW